MLSSPARLAALSLLAVVALLHDKVVLLAGVGALSSQLTTRGDVRPELSKPLVEILHPSNDLLLSTTDLQIELVIRNELSGGFVDTKVCISMDPVFIPADVVLEDGRSQLPETCFDHAVNGTTFYVEGLVPGLSYDITAGLVSHARVVALSMRTFEVASVVLPELGQRMGIALALETGAQYHNAGDRSQAARIYRSVLSMFPDHPYALHMLGLVFYQDGDPYEGYAYIQRALAGNASEDSFHNSLGLCLKSMGREHEAIQSYRRALEIRPFFYHAALNLGDALQALGKWEDAMHEYRKVAASAQQLQQQQQKSSDEFARDAWSRVCELLRVTDGARECDACLTDSIRRWPNEPAFHNDRGHLLAGAGLLEAALTEFQSAADLGSVFGMINVAETLEALGETQECLHQYQLISMAVNAANGHPVTRIRIMRATVLPLILPESEELLVFYRQRLESEIDALALDMPNLRLTEMDPSLISFSTALALNSHGRNNRVLRTKLASLYTDLLYRHRVVRESYVLTHMMIPLPYRFIRRLPTDPPLISQRRLRVAFVARSLASPRAGLYVADLIPQLSRRKYETFAFVVGLSSSMKRKDQVAQIADQISALPDDLVTARDEIRAANVDVVIFPEIGIDRLTYFLSLSRLAPVQAAWWGNPDTSGVETIDYRLVSEYEHESFPDHYSETTYQIQGLGLFHSFPEPHEYTASREQVRGAITDRFDLPPTFRMYFCMESILHLHPDFDRAVSQIFEQDEHARLFLLGRSTRNRWRDQLVARIYGNAGADVAAGRIYFLNDVDAKQELLLAGAADAVLASVHVATARPTIQAFTAGAPVVTLAGRLWGTRIVYALYQQMGIDDLIASTTDEYVALALRLARNRTFHDEMVTKIQERRSRLHEDERAVVEWEKFLDFAGSTIYPTTDDTEDGIEDSTEDDTVGEAEDQSEVDTASDSGSSSSDSDAEATDIEVDSGEDSGADADALESASAKDEL